MNTYLYELPTTGAVSFGDICVDRTPEKIYTSHISQATQARANVRAVLKENRRTDNEKDHLAIVKVLDEYLPYLRGIMGCVEFDEIGVQSVEFSWRTTLSANVLRTSPRINLPSLYADYTFALLTYAFARSNLARSRVIPLGSYEHDPATSDVERKEKDSKLNKAADWLCEASGIFAHLSGSVIPEWESSKEGLGRETARPPEIMREVMDALSKMAIADAQSLAIRKFLTRSAYDSNVAPGPPLPESHPAPGTVAKLHLECASLYASARSLVKTAGSASSNGSSPSEVTGELRRYLGHEAAFHEALAHKWLGVAGVERRKGSDSVQAGEALGYILWARKELEDLAKDGSKSISLGKTEKEKKTLRKGKVADEIHAVTVWAKHFKKLNDSIYCHPVPTQAELRARIPAGKLVLTMKTYHPPDPAFGPESVEYLRRQTEGLSFNADDEKGQGRSPSPSSKSRNGDYAGAGSYF